MNNTYVQKYTSYFKYKKIENFSNKSTYIKSTKAGFIVIESLHESKYVTFFLNDKQKKFKKSDLLLGLINQTSVAWEIENE